jgi:hypothetical protein
MKATSRDKMLALFCARLITDKAVTVFTDLLRPRPP